MELLDADLAIVMAAGFTALSAVGVALIQRNTAIEKGITETMEQVKNSHVTNLRDDLDEVYETVVHIVKVLEGMDQEMRTERAERVNLSDRMDAHISRWEATCPKPLLVHDPKECK